MRRPCPQARDPGGARAPWLHLELTIESKRLTSKGTSGVVRRRLRLINQHGTVVQDGVITVLILCREPAADDTHGAHHPKETTRDAA